MMDRLEGTGFLIMRLRMEHRVTDHAVDMPCEYRQSLD
jgi:hypothetical protein